jgi:hypothetical protein
VPGAGGLVFAKRKRSVFKGPGLSVNTELSLPGMRSLSGERKSSHSRSTSVVGRKSGELAIVGEEEEQEEEEEEEFEDVEEVDQFGPVTGEGSTVEVFLEDPAPTVGQRQPLREVAEVAANGDGNGNGRAKE